MSDGSTVLVTGAAGKLGGLVCELLGEAGFSVRALRHRRPVAADEVVSGDVTDPASVGPAVAGAAAILHLAALTHSRSPAPYRRVNVGGTANLAAAASRAGVGRMVLASTRAASPEGGAYARSKLEAERIVREAAVPHVVVRLPEVYGAGGREGVDRIVELVRAGRRVPVVGDGRDELCPASMAEAARTLVAAVTSAQASGQTYTLAGRCLTTTDFVAACARAFGSSSRPLRVPRAAVALAARIGRVLPLPIYPDQPARLRARKPPPSPEAAADLGFRPEPLNVGLERLAKGAMQSAPPS